MREEYYKFEKKTFLVNSTSSKALIELELVVKYQFHN